jgi:hypothetical protein
MIEILRAVGLSALAIVVFGSPGVPGPSSRD